VIPEPHGGKLVHRLMSDPERKRREAELQELPKFQPFIDQVYDAVQIGFGGYSPLEGFMDSATVESVLAKGRLPNDLPWTMPILLAPSGADAAAAVEGLRPGDDVALLDAAGTFFALFHLEEKFRVDKKRLAEGTYATVDPAHPNVADLFALGDVALAGGVDLVRRLDLPTKGLELSPEETRQAFGQRGWKNVVGYQTRNAPHTAHEYLQRITLEREDVDGMFVQPIVGRLKKGDYRPEIILDAYQTLIRNYYPQDRFFLSSLSITMRYAGPKAAIFFAIVRKNYGCSLYIVGRDQAGVGKYYDPYACHRIFDEYPDLGIVPLRYDETFFCRKCGWMASGRTCSHPPTDRIDTSQTRIRKLISEGGQLPPELIRPEVAQILAKRDVFVT
jgi:sulfate adenylyltransferase